jgi:hypothetical protein
MDMKQQRLLYLAGRFYTNFESPSEDDMESLCVFLIRNDVEGLEKMLLDSGLTLEEEE